MAISTTKDTAGNIQANPFATGTKKFGAGQTNNATSGKLGSAGYNARSRKKQARSAAINAVLPKSITGQQALDAKLDAKLGPNDLPAAAPAGAKPVFGSAAWKAQYQKGK